MRLVVDGLTCIRGGRSLFRGLSFDLQEGGALVVTGPNGVGKTSLLRLVAGLLTPVEGRITAANSGQTVAELCHFVGHFDAVKSALSVSENLDFGRALLGSNGSEVVTALSRVGLGALGNIPARMLSMGQRRRLALARLLVASRPIWLLDEPTASLDAEGKQTVIQLIEEHRKSGGMAIIVTHVTLDMKNYGAIDLTGGGAA